MKDITEKFEEGFGNSTKLWHTTLDAMSEPIFLIDLNQKIIQCNRATLDILGKTRYSEIVGHSCWELVHGTSGPVDWCPMKSMLESGHREVTIRQLNGRWVEISADPVINDEGKINGAVHVITDITARKKAEDALRESEQQYRTILNSLNDPMHVIDKDLRILFKNPAMTKWLNILNINSDIVGKTVFEAFPFLNYDKIYNEYDKVFITGELLVSGGITEVYNRNIITETLKIPIISEGKVSQIITILKDITEQAIVEEKYKNIIDNLMDTILIMDLKGQFLYVSPQIYDLSGFNPEEIIGKNGFKFIHPDDLNDAVEILKRAIELKERVYIEYRTLNKEGDYIYVSASGRITNIEGEDRIITVIRDISERKISEQMLKESEEKFRSITENSLMGIQIIQDNIVQYVNQRSADLLGYSVEEILNWQPGELIKTIHPDDMDMVMNHARKRQTGIRDGVNHYQYRAIKNNGDTIWLEVFAQQIMYRGRPADLGTIIDINERKKAEAKIQESEEKYRYLIENSMEGVWVVDSNANTILVNPSMAIMLGYTVEEMIGKSVISFMDEDEAEITKIHLEKRKKGISEEREAKWNHKNGSKVYLRIRATPIFDNKSNYEGTFAFLADITQRKIAEQKLKESEAKFRNITEQSLMGVAILQDDVIKYGNQKLADIFGYEIEEILSWKRGEFIKTIAPEFQDLVIEQAKKKQLGIEDILTHYKFKGIRKTGEEIWLDNYSKPIEYEGKPADLATLIDITEQKSAERKITESEENFRNIAEQAFMGIIIMQNEKVEYVNNALLQIFEYTHEEIDDWSKDEILKIIHPDDLQFLREYRQKLRADDPNIKPYYSYKVFTKSGKLKWIDQFSKSIIYKGKSAELLTIIDITEKKEAEEELIKLNSLKSELLRRTSHELKTPLVSIKGFSDLLLNVHKDKLDDYVLATVHEIKLGCERLESLIQDILKSSELESESVQLKKSQEDLSFLIKLCEKELQGLIRLRNHKINLKIHDKLVTSFEPEQIHLVISNLLNNAIKYTPPEGNIEITTEIKDSFIIISIKDTGIGITNEEKERLFTQFGKIERYGQGLDIISDGSGLGLFISKKIIELHGGDIWVESEGRNKGSTFHFSLPLIMD